ncbi:uncharacterized protein LOC134800634 [Cydia splendana]|uniref:uncharacterized protein LOC134793107 n=1 Tax=Cydia splendana TaxID=1100963 RepID=UPI00300C7469
MGTNMVSQRDVMPEMSNDLDDSGRGYIGGGDVSPTPTLGRLWADVDEEVNLSEMSPDDGDNLKEADREGSGSGAKTLNRKGKGEKRVRARSDSEEEAPERKLGTSHRGRGKGHYTGLGAARAKLQQAQQEEYETDADMDTNHSPKPRRNTGRRSRSPVCMNLTRDVFDTPGDRIKAYAQDIMKDAGKSKNLKGAIWGSINSACKELMDIADALGESDVVRSLKADNQRMRKELEHLRLETKALRTAFSERNLTKEPTVGRNDDMSALLQDMGTLMDTRLGEFKREIFVSLGEMVNARLERVEGRLPPEPILRPPLASDRRVLLDLEVTGHQDFEPSAPRPKKRNKGASQSVSQMASSQTSGGASRVAELTQLLPSPVGQVKTRPVPAPRAKKSQEAVPAARAPRGVARPSVPPPAPPQDSWTTVVKKNKGKGKGSAPPQSQQQQTPTRGTAPKKTTAPKLVAPNMAAVVVALKPEAQTDYRTVMEKATTLKLAELGVNHLKVRKSATGARIIEVPGAQSSQAADNLADRLRDLIGDVADVYRPVKKAEIKISGFNESVTPEIIKKEVAARGNCKEEQVMVGAIRMAANGSGSVIIRCPLTTAKVVVTAGRIVLGWSAARVEALEQLPLRCYRCMGTGHTRPLCPSPVDRGNWCYRCSKPGHMSKDCTALAPWCAVCHHAGLKAGHVMGGQACTPPPVRGKEACTAGPGAAAAAASPNVPDNRTEQQLMDI